MPTSTSPFRFDAATAIAPGADGSQYTTTIDGGFTIGPKAHGGYLLALAARAAGAALASQNSVHIDPLATTAHFLRSPDAGPAEIDVVVLRQGRSASQVRTTIIQEGKPQVEATFTMGALEPEPTDPWWTNVSLPAMAPIEDCIRLEADRPGAPFRVNLSDHVDMRADPAVLRFAVGEPTGRGELRTWISFTDGRPIDPLALLLFLDALPPASLDLVPSGWIPTLSLTAYLRSRPAPGPLLAKQYIRTVQDERMDESCELWDTTGRLVGQATQLAGIRLPEGAEPPAR